MSSELIAFSDADEENTNKYSRYLQPEFQEYFDALDENQIEWYSFINHRNSAPESLYEYVIASDKRYRAAIINLIAKLTSELQTMEETNKRKGER